MSTIIFKNYLLMPVVGLVVEKVAKNKQNKGKLVDLNKFRKAVNLTGSKSTIEWEISYDK